MSPIVPVLVIAALGGAGVAIHHWWVARKAGTGAVDERPTPDQPDPEPEPEPEPGQEDKPKPSGANTKCIATGQDYDLDRWSSPIKVMAAMISIGYPVSDSLKSASDKKQITAFQKKAFALGVRGYKNAKSGWFHGRMKPCTLVALSDFIDKGYTVATPSS